MAAQPNINGVVYDHSSARIRLRGVTEQRIEELSYAHGMEGVNKQYGTSAQPLSRTRGRYTPDAVSLTMHAEAWHDFKTRLGAGFMEAVWDLIAEYKENGAAFVKDTIKGCKITKVEKATSGGGDHQSVKLTLDCMYVLENGVAPIQNFKR